MSYQIAEPIKFQVLAYEALLTSSHAIKDNTKYTTVSISQMPVQIPYKYTLVYVEKPKSNSPFCWGGGDFNYVHRDRLSALKQLDQ